MISLDMVMPSNCHRCPFSHHDIDDRDEDKIISICNIKESIILEYNNDGQDKKPENCPLIQNGSTIKIDIDIPKTCYDCPAIGTDINERPEIGGKVFMTVCNVLKCKVSEDKRHRNCPMIAL